MKRLFMVKDTKTGKRHAMEGAGTSPYFEDKQQAKKLRDECNKEFDNGGTRFVISKGPDHMGNHGHSVARMRRQPKVVRTTKEGV